MDLIINTPEVTHNIRKSTTVHQVSVLHGVIALVLIPNEMYMALGVCCRTVRVVTDHSAMDKNNNMGQWSVSQADGPSLLVTPPPCKILEGGHGLPFGKVGGGEAEVRSLQMRAFHFFTLFGG